MNILIITAHPSEHGFTHKIEERYRTQSKKAGHMVQTIDLYDPQWQQPFLAFENPREFPENETRTTIQELITWADELVFIHPLWWGSMPAIMKNFIDQNITSGFAFKYVRRKYIPKKLNILPKGLLKGKQVRLFITCDAYWILYAFMLFPFIIQWRVFIVTYCGLRFKSWKLYSAMRLADEKKRNKWLDRCCPHRPKKGS